VTICRALISYQGDTSDRPIIQHATKPRPPPRGQFDKCTVDAFPFLEADLNSALPRRSDGLQTGSLPPDTRCSSAAMPAHESIEVCHAFTL
jgi:hypothetical protein